MVEPVASAPADKSLVRQVLGGLIAAAIALAGFLPPLLHFVTGPLGPLLGAFLVAQRLKPDARGCVVIGLTLGAALAAIGAGATAAIVGFAGPSGPPEWFPQTGALAAILAVVAAYAATLGTAGAWLGARWNRSDSAAVDQARSS